MPLHDSLKDAAIRSLLVFVGAGLGGNARYWLGGFISSRTSTTFPWGTFVINATGSLLIGLATGILLSNKNPIEWRLFIVVGFLGGYTTFSSFSQETLSLIQDRSYSHAFANAMGSCILGLICAWGGLVLSRLLARG